MGSNPFGRTTLSHCGQATDFSETVPEMDEREVTPDPKKFRWTERRTARFAMLLVSGAVVVGDLFLLYVFLRSASGLPGGWKPYWYIPAGIAAVFLFAMGRFRRHLSHFRRDE